jgi:hypothetical protein
MKRIKPWSLVSAILLITLITSQASYLVEDEILLLRSQYFPEHEVIIADGILDEEYWSKAGSLVLEYNETFLLEIKYMNGIDNLYFAITVTDTQKFNDSIGLYFDTDGDGKLTQPEDAKIAKFEKTTFKAYDYYWDGDAWNKDRIDPSTDDEYDVGAKLVDEKLTYEFKIALVSSNIQYDGLQITNPSGMIIAFSVQVITSDEVVYNFPSNPNNASGYVDIKLAGPEDQDLPAYIPPEYITETQGLGDYYTQADEGMGFMDLSFYAFIIPVFVLSIIYRRKKNSN